VLKELCFQSNFTKTPTIKILGMIEKEVDGKIQIEIQKV
jgi:hypothetical protein